MMMSEGFAGHGPVLFLGKLAGFFLAQALGLIEFALDLLSIAIQALGRSPRDLQIDQKAKEQGQGNRDPKLGFLQKFHELGPLGFGL